MVGIIANTLNIITVGETLANSLGAPTLLSNVCRVANTTANGTVLTFVIGGQSLPVTFGSATIYPPVTLSIACGANGNATDQTVLSGTVYPTQDQNGQFFVEGCLILKGNGVAGGGNVNTVWWGVMQVPQTGLGGDVKTVLNAGTPGANGNINAQLISANTCNISFLAQSVTGQNNNAAIDFLQVTGSNAAITGL